MSPKGKPGKPRHVISDWVDIDDPEIALTIIAALGWGLALYLFLHG